MDDNEDEELQDSIKSQITKNKKDTKKAPLSLLQQLFERCGWKRSAAVRLSRSASAEEQDDTHESILYIDAAVDAFTHIDYTIPFLERLEMVGIKKVVAKALYERTKALLEEGSSFTDAQVFELCLECTLGHHDEYRPGSSFLIMSDVRDQWFSASSGGSIYNWESTPAARISKVIDEIPQPVSPNSKLYYHTTSWRSYDSIREIGIDTSYGRKCCDFGIRPSFYLTPSITVALQYAEKRSLIEQDEISIMIFSLPDPLPFRVKWWPGGKPSREWVDLVTSSRLCKVGNNALDAYDFIYGQMCANPSQVLQRGAPPKAHVPPKYQLATKRRGLSIVADGLIGAIFIKKNKNTS